MSLGVSPDITVNNSDGSTDLYASPSGMIGAEINGVWIMTIPPDRRVYRTNYAGTSVVISRYGNRYSLQMPGIPTADRMREYDPRFLSAPYFDAAGNPHQTPATVQVGGDPQALFFTPGPVASGSTTTSPATTGPAVTTTIVETESGQEIVTTVTPGTPDNQNATVAPGQESWTRSTDGRTDVFFSDSGMVGGIVRTVGGSDIWALWMPTVGVVYESFYLDGLIKGTNYGDGTYQLDADGVNARRRYASRWQPGKYYDSNGNQIASASDARIARDPGPAFFTPGPIVPGTAATQTTGPGPGDPVTMPGVSPTGPIQPVTPTGGGDSGYTTAPFPSSEHVAAEYPQTGSGGSSGLSTGAVLAIAAAAAAFLM